jgi:multicomponent Na+:H+ antiporter subunit E
MIPPDIPPIPTPPQSDSIKILQSLPPHIADTLLTCPLCSAVVPARGIRPRPLRGTNNAQWQFVFTCPACGLLSSFNTKHLSREQIQAISGSPWIGELRQLKGLDPIELPGLTSNATPRQLVGTFLLTFLVWMLLIGNFNPVEVLWGAFVSLGIAALTYRFAAIDVPMWTLKPRAWLALVALIIEFVRQIIVQNITLSLRVFRPKMPIRPGIVAVPTSLKSDISLTILGSLMTLTPDTVTLDVDQQNGIIYVHWIDVSTTDPIEIQKLLAASLEDKIQRWLE